MYLFLYRLRILLTILAVVVIAGGIFTLVSVNSYEAQIETYNVQVTAAVATAIQDAVFDITRTVEAPSNRYRLVTLEPETDLRLLAEEYDTTLELLQVVNSLAADVTTGSGNTLVVPVGITEMEPLRTVTPYRVRAGDTLESIAEEYVVDRIQLEADNPMLVRRGLYPGDIVFIGLEL